jgi:histidinol-phosphate aminotransferase
MHPYVPGEQPKVPGLIKLNTNENPYPPSPRVIAAVHAATTDALRLYPDPTASGLREKLAAMHGLNADQIVAGNGCDDILNLCVRAFCDTGDAVAWFQPSYSLYPVLADIQGATKRELPLTDHFQIDAHPSMLRQLDGVRLLFVTQPNAPSGAWLQKNDLQRVIETMKGVVVIDEAYVDFASDHCLDFAREYPNVIVARTFSKSYALAGMRIGWAVGATELITGLSKTKDSYNVTRLSQVAAEAALDDADYFAATVAMVRATRDRVSRSLSAAGFDVVPTQTNFVFARPPSPLTAQQWFDGLRQRKILVRWWDADRIRDRARVSIGTDAEMDRFLAATNEILAGSS